MRTTYLLVLAGLALGGCAAAPAPLQGEFSMLEPERASAERVSNEQVRWGGSIIATVPDSEQTCFEILGRELGETARPLQRQDQSSGRFLACRAGFYDPAIFTPEREVTVTGRIIGFELRRIGEFEYRYPRIAAEVIYLWPERRRDDRYLIDPFWPHHRSYFWGGYRSLRWHP
jgi:outer membrane lipoprotein